MEQNEVIFLVADFRKISVFFFIIYSLFWTVKNYFLNIINI